MIEEDIVKQLIEWNKSYRDGKPDVPDSVYDSLLEQLPKDHKYRNEIEEEVVYKNHITHSKPLLSMQKAKTDEEVNKWFNKVTDSAIEIGLPIAEILICTNAKLDGIAGVLENEKIATRGSGIEGNDVTNSINKGVVIKKPEGHSYENRILGEFVVNLKYFKDNLHNFSNPRNFISGAIMADTLNNDTRKAFKDKAVIFQSYSGLPAFVSTIEATREDFRKYEETIWDNSEYLIDGIIFMVVNQDLQEHMGCTSHHPNYALAVKPKDKIYTSKVTKIHWNAGRTGKITPRIEIEPVDIDGVIVTFATGHNASMVVNLGIDVGKTVEIIRSGSVIPYIVRVIEYGQRNTS